MENKASAQWLGSLKDGKGTLTTPSGVLNNAPYTFASRFEGAKGTNPEELIAAAHSGCFSMALTAEMGRAKISPDSVETNCVVILEKQGEGFAITESRLTTTVTAHGADRNAIEQAAASAKENCPISKLLNARISLTLHVNV